MKVIWKWKKTIILVALLVIIAVLSVSMLAFLPREITIDNDNPTFCYDTNAILTQKAPHEKYPNVFLMATAKGKTNEVNVMYNSGQYFTIENKQLDKEIVEVLGFVEGVKYYKGIEIYYLINTTSPKVLERCPGITAKMDGEVAQAVFNTKNLKTFAGEDIKLKIVVKVV